MISFGQIGSLLQSMMPAASAGFVSDSGSPSELAYYLRLTNAEIAGGEHRFGFTMREYSLMLTGASTYNLATLIPDLVSLWNPQGDNVAGYEMAYRNSREYNLTRGGQEFTIVGMTLKFRNPPTSGTLVIPYYSNYLVLDQDGTTRKLDFEDADDTSILPNHLTPLLIEGTLRYYIRKEKEPQFLEPTLTWDGRVVNLGPFQKLYWSAVQSDNIVKDPIYDYRFV